MEQAATIDTHQTNLPISACVRLRQGSSARATWILDEAPGGTTITVGADDTCDWQIRAAFVPASAFALRLADGEVRVQAGTAQSVLLNGKLLGQGWTTVPSGARIDVGLARVEVSTAVGAARFDAPTVPRGAARFDARPPPRALVTGHAASTMRSHAPQRAATMSSHAATRPLQSFADVSVAPRAALSLPPSTPRFTEAQRDSEDAPEESGEFELPHHRSHASNPALLERDQAGDTGALRRYALVGVATACAYGGWLALLDFL